MKLKTKKIEKQNKKNNKIQIIKKQKMKKMINLFPVWTGIEHSIHCNIVKKKQKKN